MFARMPGALASWRRVNSTVTPRKVHAALFLGPSPRSAAPVRTWPYKSCFRGKSSSGAPLRVHLDLWRRWQMLAREPAHRSWATRKSPVSLGGLQFALEMAPKSRPACHGRYASLCASVRQCGANTAYHL